MNNIIQTPIVNEVEQSFLDYSLSVITDRAIPAVEDGLKPVMRRILWCMVEKGYKNDKQYVKCARPVGDTMGMYHPHGESSIYGALVGASQPWNMRYPLIDFHGNNGSRDGDSPAAMRYTECRLSKISEATLNDIKKETVDWVPNFDETTSEPVYLPGLFPNLLCNGTTGIAVAMACSFAPHNLHEVMDAIIAYIEGHAKNSEELAKILKAPDFPTGGQIINQKELSSIYTTGKGRIKLRGQYTVEKNKGQDILVFYNIPYKVSKENLLTEIDGLCEEGKLSGIQEIRDESNKQGVRFVIIPQKGINPDVLAAQLYAQTDLEITFNVNMVGLVNKTPKQLTLLDVIQNYVDHQKDVYRRKNEYEKKQLENRIHILEGLCKALADIDIIVKIIRGSKDKAAARDALMKQYGFDTLQADAILAMALSRLANMEKLAIQQEKEDKEQQLALILTRLNNETIFNKDLTAEFINFRDKFSDDRRTEVTNIEVTKEEKEVAQIIPEDVMVIVTEAGNAKRVPIKNFKIQKRNGKGIKTQDDITMATIDTNTIDIILVFTNMGRVYRLGVDQIPEGTQATRGTAISTMVDMLPNEKVVAITSMARNEKDKYVWFVTRNGLIKKTNISEYEGSKRKAGIQALNLREGDSLVSVWVKENTDVLLLTEKGMGIRFDGASVGTTGRNAIGVQGIKLNTDDYIAVGCGVRETWSGLDTTTYGQVFIGYSDGSGKRLEVREFTRQGRGGKGLKVVSSGTIVTAIGNLIESDNVFISGERNSICIKMGDLSMGSRISAPIKVIKDTRIVSAARV